MKMKLYNSIFAALILIGGSLYAEDEATKTEVVTSPDPLQQLEADLDKNVPAAPAKNTKITLATDKLLSMGVRIDSSFSGGGAVQQGFSIPSMRLTAFGEAGKNIDYRLSVGQTREFSTALLPQLLTTEAYMVLATNPPRDGVAPAEQNLSFKFGIHTPTLNPWWTPDLGDLAIPDYNLTSRALFVQRDIGAELGWSLLQDQLRITAGAFNGSGIMALNTNNSLGLNGNIHVRFPMEGMTLGLGIGLQTIKQSTRGAINFKRKESMDVFGYLDSKYFRLGLEWFNGEYEDSLLGLRASGYAVLLNVPFSEWFGLFGRYESLNDSAQYGKIEVKQIGPTFNFSDYVRAFVTFREELSNNSTEQSIDARIRLNI